MRSTNCKAPLFFMCAFYVLIWKCKAQNHELIVNRNINDQQGWNNLKLLCRDTSSGIDHSDYFFWVNSTQMDLKDITNSEVTSGGLAITIRPDIEGEYFCGPNRLLANLSPKKMVVAYPTFIPGLETTVKRVEVGRNAVLNPLVPPGSLLTQYYIDWMNQSSLVTFSRIDGPRTNSQPITDLEGKYSTNPETFALTIQSVSFEDHGLYLGVLGVADPAGQMFTYEQTQDNGVMLEVYVPPRFIQPPEDKVVSLSTTRTVSFTCKVEGFPLPNIRWTHNNKRVDPFTMAEKYYIRTGPGSQKAVVSYLTIYSLMSLNSGNVSCVATVPGVAMEEVSVAHLSVLGEVQGVETFITTNPSVIFNVRLVKPLRAEIQLYIAYTHANSGVKFNKTTAARYRDSEMITYYEDHAPFDVFTVEVGLVSGELAGPVHPYPRTYDLSQPSCSEFNLTLVRYLVPVLGALLALIIIIIPISIFLCCIFLRSRPGLDCIYNIRPEREQKVFTADSTQKLLGPPPGAVSAPPDPNMPVDNSLTSKCEKKRWAGRFTASKEAEAKAEEFLQLLRDRVDRNRDRSRRSTSRKSDESITGKDTAV